MYMPFVRVVGSGKVGVRPSALLLAGVEGGGGAGWCFCRGPSKRTLERSNLKFRLDYLLLSSASHFQNILKTKKTRIQEIQQDLVLAVLSTFEII